MVGASPLTCSGNFLLRLAACPGKDLTAEARRAALVAGRSMRAPGKSLLYQSRNCAVESTDRHACLSEAVPQLDLSCSACHSIEPGAQLVLVGVAPPRSFSLTGNCLTRHSGSRLGWLGVLWSKGRLAMVGRRRLRISGRPNIGSSDQHHP
jgi:hypothetical protein